MIFNRPVQKKQSDTLVRSLARSRVTATPDEEEPIKSVTDYFSDFYGNGGDPTTEVNPGDDVPSFRDDPNALSPKDLQPVELNKVPKYEPTSDEDYLDTLYKDYINGLKKTSGEGRKALGEQLDQSANEALLTQEARAGAAGLGLSGAAQSIQGGLTAQLARQRALGLDQYDQDRRQELIGGISKFGDYLTDKQEAALSAEDRGIYRDFLEKEQDSDLDGDGDVGGIKVDGNIGDGNPDNNDAGEFGDETNSDPVGPDTREDLATKTPALNTRSIDLGDFRAGDQYMGSDSQFDYYFSVDDHQYYKVRFA